MLVTLIARIEVHPERVELHLSRPGLMALLEHGLGHLDTLGDAAADQGERLDLTIHARPKRVGYGVKMIVGGARARQPDPSLIKLLIKAQDVRDRFLKGESESIAAFARSEGMTESYVTRHLRLAFLAPDIVQSILKGDQPATLTAAQLVRDTRLPLAWPAQRAALGFA